MDNKKHNENPATNENIKTSGKDDTPDIVWDQDDHYSIVQSLISHGCQYIKGRDEYTLMKEIINPDTLTDILNYRQTTDVEDAVVSRSEGSGVISHYAHTIELNDTDTSPGTTRTGNKLFLTPLDIQKAKSIADEIASFKIIQSDEIRLNIGMDTETQYYIKNGKKIRHVLSIQMTVALGETLIRYFFLVDPRYQRTTVDGGCIPLKLCMADVLYDLKKCYIPQLPLLRKEDLIFKEKAWKGHEPFKYVDFKAMRDFVIPVTIVCHAAKADLSVFRKHKYDLDLLRYLAEIQAGLMSVSKIYFKAENDKYYNNYWLIDLSVRDTMGLTPADNKTLEALGGVINHPKIILPDRDNTIKHMASYAVSNPVEFYKYAMNDSDIVILFCTELFGCNRSIPVTLSSAAASSMFKSVKEYFGLEKRSDYDRIYRGLEMVDESGLIQADEMLKYLKATRYVPIRDNPDAKWIIEFCEEAYVGGFNASFFIGWITEVTRDYDLKNAYPTVMSKIVDADHTKRVIDFPRNYVLTLKDVPNPLIPAAAVGDVDYPDDCYCPNIPVTAPGGMKVYPLHGKNVYMVGPDMYLALRLGAKITIDRGFICQTLEKNGEPSCCLSYAVSQLVQDRALAKKLYQDQPLIEKALKTMVCSCYGKTGQNVSPKTRYCARKKGRVDAGPSAVTSPYHAAYTTALVRCMLIACINELHNMKYHVYSVTTDGFITDAPLDVLNALDAYGFTEILQEGRYILNQTRADCDENHVWEQKHYNETFLNITTRGNVAINDEGVLAHNSYITGETKGSRADRDAYLIAVLAREHKLECPTKVWAKFSELVERKRDFEITDTIRNLSMDFDYKRKPVTETAVDTPVHYDSADGKYSVDTVIAEFDTKPFYDVEEFMNYRKAKASEVCIKVKDDLERVKVKSSYDIKGYIGKNLARKILLSIIMGYREGIYKIPVLDGLKQSRAVDTINSWGIVPFTINDWKNCSRSSRRQNMLPREVIEETLQMILNMYNDDAVVDDTENDVSGTDLS